MGPTIVISHLQATKIQQLVKEPVPEDAESGENGDPDADDAQLE